MKLFFISILFLLFSFKSYSQSYTIEWGELERRHGKLIYLLPGDSNEFHALRWTGSRVLGHYQLSKHKDLQFINSELIKLHAEKSMANFEGARIFGGKLFVFLSDKRDGNNYFYMREYGKNLKPLGEPIKIATYKLGKGKKFKGWYDIKVSENGEYFSVVWEIPGKKDSHHRYGFKIFDQKMALINEGDYPLPFESTLSEIHSHQISNKGDYFLTVTEFQEIEKIGLFGDVREFKALHIFHIADDGLQDFVLEVEGKRIEAMAMTTSGEDIFTITGIYGEPEEYGVKGVFYQRMNIKTGKILSEGFKEFGKEFIIQGWSEKAKKKAKRKEDNGKGEPQLYSYEMCEATILNDGSIIGTLEQYYVQVNSFTDTRTGTTSNTYYYYYNDIITYKIGLDGEFEWLQKVRKHQVSTNDTGPYSSYESFVDNGNIYFIFNDHISNYNESGDFVESDKLYTASFGKRKNVVVIAEVDMETGELSRKTLFDRSKIQALAVPKLFEVNYETGEMLIYTIHGNKEKIGLIRFKE